MMNREGTKTSFSSPLSGTTKPLPLLVHQGTDLQVHLVG